ncbi:MAG: endonuclease/exonuclease/phosphatase family protein [Desulfobacterales bacterium]
MKNKNSAIRKPAVTKGFSTLTLNLRFGLADDGVNSWDHRKEALPALFKKYDSDFIGLQEANDFQIDYLAKILIGYEFIGKRSPAPPNWQNNVIFFKRKWAPEVYQHLFLSKTPTIPSKFRDSRWPRQCTIGMFTSNNRTLICINTHFDFAENVQTNSAVLIMEQLSKLPPNVPAIILGDFNATPKQNCYGVFTGENDKYSFKGPWFKNAATKPLLGTYHGFKGRTDGDHIDWILYRGNIAPANYNVEVSTFEGIYPSDHFPVYAKFRWVDKF